MAVSSHSRCVTHRDLANTNKSQTTADGVRLGTNREENGKKTTKQYNLQNPSELWGNKSLAGGTVT